MYRLSLILLTIVLSLNAQAQSLAIKIDGNLDDTLWRSVQVHSMSKDGKLFTRLIDNKLYLAIDHSGTGWPHVYIKKGDKVYAHHASASLGTAVYHQNTDQWDLVESFTWKLNNIPASELISKQVEHLNEHSWVANTINNGSGAREFIIDTNGDTTLQFAVVYFAFPSGSSFFPTTINDGRLNNQLLMGYPPSSIKVSTGWLTLAELSGN